MDLCQHWTGLSPSHTTIVMLPRCITYNNQALHPLSPNFDATLLSIGGVRADASASLAKVFACITSSSLSPPNLLHMALIIPQPSPVNLRPLLILHLPSNTLHLKCR